MFGDFECPKCKGQAAATGCHEEDDGEHTCETCGFKFVVEIEYEPAYLVSCESHEYADWITTNEHPGYEYRSCKLCDHMQVRPVELPTNH